MSGSDHKIQEIEKWPTHLTIHSWAVIYWLHLTLIHAWRCRATISLLRGVHMSASTRTALLHALSLLQCGILSTRRCVHHWTRLHAMRQVSAVKHLTIDGTKVAVGECTQILTDVRVCVSFPYRLICIHLQTVLTNRWQMYSHKHLHTQKQSFFTNHNIIQHIVTSPVAVWYCLLSDRKGI